MVTAARIVPDNEPDGELMYLYAGGGSLIHREVVLTAAHIVTGNHATVIRAGEWDTQTTEEPLPHQEREVKKIVTHKKFNADNLHYDIALLFLSEPLDLAPNVGLVCLPPPRQRATAGTSCIVAGWGKDKFGKEGYIRALLRK
ncbi:jg1315 [Pararge aegeria aegeria]|nr:jg1315 [Pararge aegeria aegeria]